MLTALRAGGVADDDIETESFRVYPISRRNDGMPTSYEVYNSLLVTVRNLDDVGTLLQAAVTAGANSVSGVNFRLEDPSPVQAQAEGVVSGFLLRNMLANL